MVVDDVPDIDSTADRLEQIVIGLGRRQVLTRRRLDLGVIAPRAALADFALEYESRFARIVRHLDRQHAALRQRRQQALHDRRMIRQPLHHGIAENEIGAGFRGPGCDIALHELAGRQPFARFAQHVRRRIEPDYLRLRKALDQKLSGIARPAAEIDHKARICQRHLREQIARRPCPLVLKFQILPRAPIFHR